MACGESVCLTPEDTAAIWLYVRETDRWQARVGVCLGTIKPV